MRTNYSIWLQRMTKGSLSVCLFAFAFFLTGCDEINPSLEDMDEHEFLSDIFSSDQESMKVSDVKFSPDYKTFSITTCALRDLGPYELKDSTKVRTEVVETLDGIRKARYSAPKLVEIRNIESERIFENDIRLLVLVDLTLSRKDLEHIRTHIEEIRTIFNHDNFFIAFMDSTSVSNTMQVTDYVVSNRLKKSNNHYVCLYRSILEKKKEMMQNEGVWKDARRKVMLVYSNEKVYQDGSDEPVDPNHYLYEEQMVQDDPTDADSTFTAFYASIGSLQEVEDHEENVLSVFCGNHGGTFMQDHSLSTFKRLLRKAYHLSFPDNEFLFVNPDYKVYRGDKKKLTVSFYYTETDSLKANFSTTVEKGSIFNPIIVNGYGVLYVILQGLFVGTIIFLLVWLVLQFLVPFIRYRIFKKKYVIRYTGSNMSVGNRMVEERCYLCKAPFEADEEVVVKCEHTMHKTCWDENDYHCPEYSDRCKHGSHYYNRSNLFDAHNATFYMKWVLMAIVAATMSWACFILYVPLGFDFIANRILRNDASQMPILGFLLGFLLTLGITMLALRPADGSRAVGQKLLRSFIAGVGCYLAFMIVNLFILLFGLDKIASLLNWIPWMVSAFIIAYSSTIGTRIVHNKLFIAITVVLSMITTITWLFSFNYTELDFRVMLLYSFIVFSVGLALCVAVPVGGSNRCFLRVEGAVKTMEIALYKWFRADSHQQVTIGKSVNCNLQMSWDLNGEIAPIQAEIRREGFSVFLRAVEDGVKLSNGQLEVEKEIRLYHGTKFQIGQTTFTYIEKDL